MRRKSRQRAKAGVAINYGDRPASSPYTTRAAIRPDRRLQTSHPGGAKYASSGARRKPPLRTPDIAKRVEPSEGVHAQSRSGPTSDRASPACRIALCQSRLLSTAQHEADGCSYQRLSTGPRRAKKSRGGASLAVSSPKEAAKKWALRAPSRAQRRQRRAHDRPPSTMVKASRFELSNPGLRGPNAKRAPGRPVCP